MRATVWEAEFVNGQSQKFYRCYALGTLEIRQWGRIGAKGQFKVIHHHDDSVAAISASDQWHSKVKKGYTTMHRGVIFQVPDGKVTSIGTNPSMISNIWEAAQRGADTNQEVRDLQQHIHQTMKDSGTGPAVIAERALSAITVAVTDPVKAAVTLATLREQWAEQEESIEQARSYLSTLEELVTS